MNGVGTVPPDEGLAGVLAERARTASDTRLILDIAAGLLGALAVAIWHPRAWVVPFSIGICLAAFGAWGIADREIAERVVAGNGRLVPALRFLRGSAAVTGVLSAAVACVAILGVGLGNWKS